MSGQLSKTMRPASHTRTRPRAVEPATASQDWTSPTPTGDPPPTRPPDPGMGMEGPHPGAHDRARDTDQLTSDAPPPPPPAARAARGSQTAQQPRQTGRGRPVRREFANYLEKVNEDREHLHRQIRSTPVSSELLDAEEDETPVDPIFAKWERNAHAFQTLFVFSPADFLILYALVEGRLTLGGRGRPRAIGPKDSLLLFLNWLRTGNSLELVATGFELKKATVDRTVKEVARVATPISVDRFITRQARMPFPAQEDFADCGLVVDARVQDRGRPVGTQLEAKSYYSGKHHLYCLKSQVVTNRDGLAVLVDAGVRGATHDLTLFRQGVRGVEALIDAHPGEPCKILADKAYIGDSGSPRVVLVTPIKKEPGLFLTAAQLTYNRIHARNRIVVENFFGRLTAKFSITLYRWAGDVSLYPTVFLACCALVNFDLRPDGGSPLRRDDGHFYRRCVTREILEAIDRERAGHPGGRRWGLEIGPLRNGHQVFHTSDSDPDEEDDVQPTSSI